MCDQTVSPNSLFLSVCFRVSGSTKCCCFLDMVFFGLSLLVVSGCVKVLSVLGWFIMISLGGSNWGTQTSWSGIRSVCSNRMRHCCFMKRPCFMITGSGMGCDRTVLLNSGFLVGFVSCLGSFPFVCSFLRLFVSSSFFLSFLLSLSHSFSLSLSLSLSRLDLQDQAARSLTTT